VLLAALEHDLKVVEVVRRLSALGLEMPNMAAKLPELLARVPFKPSTEE
jgi:hypothetical protein